MYDGLPALFDASLAEHWPDAVVVASIAALGWLVTHLISALEVRLSDAEDTGIDHEKRLIAMESVAKERERRASADRGHD